MKRVFKHTKDGHWKFWTIEVSGCEYVTTYGKLDPSGDHSLSSGKQTTKTFSSSMHAASEADKVIHSKLKKGYEESLEDKVALPVREREFWRAHGSLLVIALEKSINNLLVNYAAKFDAELVLIQDCTFRSIPRSMEYTNRNIEDENKPLVLLAQQIDALILAERREVCECSSSPYIKGCAAWYRDNWDPMFLLEDNIGRVVRELTEVGPHWQSPSMMQDVFDELASRGIIPETCAETTLTYTIPTDKLVLLPSVVLSNTSAMERYGNDLDVGQVWITSNGRDRVKRFVKVSKTFGAWYLV